MTKQYVLNQETQKIELEFTRESYKGLSNEDQKILKRAYLFSGSRKVWVSRSTKDHYSAIRAAQQLGFVDGGKIGERLSFAQEVEQQVDKATARVERYEYKAEKAIQTGQQLQKGWNEARQDWSYVTQPIIAGHAGSQRFGKQREKVMNRYTKGFDEYRKSEYFKEKANTSAETASMSKFNDTSYLYNRIEECNKILRQCERAMVRAEESNNEKRMEQILEKMEYELDKLAYMTNKFEEIGGNQFNKETLKIGYEVKIRGGWDKIVKLNTKTVYVKSIHSNGSLSYHYADIKDVRIPEDWAEVTEQSKVNPFQVNDIVIRKSMDGRRIINAFQVMKKTDKSVTLQAIQVVENLPQLNQFTDEKMIRRNVKERFDNTYVVNFEDWYLYKYIEMAS